MDDILIKDLKPGQKIEGIFALKSSRLLSFRDGSGYYMAVILGDKSGQLEGRVWEEANEAYRNNRTGEVVKVRGQVAEYNDKLQLQVTSISTCPDFEIDPARFVPASSLEPGAGQEQLMLLIESVNNGHLKDLLTIMFKDAGFYNAFVQAPAAKRNHHASIGGLLEHSLGVAASADRLAVIYPQLDRDLLVTGALLHDAGKIQEYRLGAGIDFTDEGRLLGHIVLGVRLLELYLAKLPHFPEDLKVKLLHMIISHHGKYEWQSPKKPKFLEAAVLHHLDMIDADINMFSSAAANREDQSGHWTGWVQALERYIYCK